MKSAAWHWIYRHSLPVRAGHWINVICLTILLMSGLQIFNAHPALYWGGASQFTNPILEIGTQADAAGQPHGVVSLMGHIFDTTGVLGLSTDQGQQVARGFPAWATLPSPQWLAMGRTWHFFFAWLLVLNGAVYLLYGAFAGHLRRDLLTSGRDLRHIGRSLWEHLRLHFPRGKEAERYNVLQKLAYLGVIFVILPVLILAGLAMSPRLDAGFPWLPALFGGRQSARTVHFICAFALVLFTLVHVVMVLLSGVWNNLRSMITGYYVIRDEADHDAH
ncbi:MAG: cytochrome b/b6 domain-containing protein [Alphaproteobacteria bacterium]|nr:cytochrome b/b6 domain-containing protein [Alphaproteobacteria bacterium]